MTISLGWTWTDERVAELRRLSGLGYSNQQICEAMRAPSRNTIAGKRARLRLTNNRKRGELAATPVELKAASSSAGASGCGPGGAQAKAALYSAAIGAASSARTAPAAGCRAEGQFRRNNLRPAT